MDLLIHQAPTNKWSLVSHVVSCPFVRPLQKTKKRKKAKIAPKVKQNHATMLHGAWWITKFARLVFIYISYFQSLASRICLYVPATSWANFWATERPTCDIWLWSPCAYWQHLNFRMKRLRSTRRRWSMHWRRSVTCLYDRELWTSCTPCATGPTQRISYWKCSPIWRQPITQSERKW